MPAIINYKICDQSSECSGIDVCPVGAIKYNEDIGKIEIDKSKCLSCGLCENACPIGAIGVAKNKEEYEELISEIENDPRSVNDLFVDRYGADVINTQSVVKLENLEQLIQEKRMILIEVYNDESINCLLKSIPYSNILDNTRIDGIFKCNVGDIYQSALSVSILPSLLIIIDGKIINKVEGYFEIEDQQKLFDIINDTINIYKN